MATIYYSRQFLNDYIEASKPNHLIASLLIVPSFLALFMALLKSFKSFASLFPIASSPPFLIPTPTPFPKAPPEKVGPTSTTASPDLSA